MELDKKNKYFLLEVNEDLEKYFNTNKIIKLKSFDNDLMYFISEDKCYKVIRNVYSNTFCLSNENAFVGFTNDKLYLKEVNPSYSEIDEKFSKITKNNLIDNKFLNLNDILDKYLISKIQLINYINSLGGIIEENGDIIFVNIKEIYNEVINFASFLRLKKFDQSYFNLLEIEKENDFNFNLHLIILNSKLILDEVDNGYNKIKVDIILESLLIKILEKTNELYYYDLIDYLLKEINKIVQQILFNDIKNLNFLIFEIISKYGIRVEDENFNESNDYKTIIFKSLNNNINNPKKKLIYFTNFKTKYTREEIDFYFKNLFDNEVDFEKFFKKFFKKCYIEIDEKNLKMFYDIFIELKFDSNNKEEMFYQVKKIW